MAKQILAEKEALANGVDMRGRPVVTKVEEFGLKLAHQFPWAPAAYVAVGLALRRRFLSDPDAPSSATRRKQITKARLPFSAPNCSAWQCLPVHQLYSPCLIIEEKQVLLFCTCGHRRSCH